MNKIKLKDYKGEYVCYINSFRNIEIVEADDIEYIKELIVKGKKIYGTIEKQIFNNPHWDMQLMIAEFIETYGSEDIENNIGYHTDEFKNLVSAFEKWIKSIGNTNYIYYPDKRIVIEVTDESME